MLVRKYSSVEPTVSTGSPSEKWDENSARFYSNQSFDQTKSPDIKVDFKTDSTNSLANIAIEGMDKSLGLEYDSGTIYVRLEDGTNVSYPAVALGSASPNTWYTAEFDFSSTDAKVYVYPQGGAKGSPAYTFNVSNWNPALRFYNRVGNTSIDNVSVKDRKETFDYLYDNLNRLTKVTDINNSTVDYTYDAEGNRETKVTGEGTTSYHYTAANELDVVTKPDASTVNYTYDDNGNTVSKTELTNQTTNYTYDNKNQLVKVEKPNNDVIEYTYDGNGNRYLKKITSGGNTTYRYYHYDTGGNILTETDENKNVLVRYVRDTSGKAISMIQGSNAYYFEYNAHGDVTSLTDSTGNIVATYTYDEFGNLKSSTGSTYNPLRYSGVNNAYFDEETSLYKMGVRYYQSEVGRWLTRDNYEGELKAPQTQNRYVYVENSPVSSADPTGNLSKSITKLLKKLQPGDVILTRYILSYGLPVIATYWTHSTMKIRPGKRYYSKKKKKYINGKMRSRIAESNSDGKTDGDGSRIWALWPTFERRDYDVVGLFRIKNSKYKSQAINKMGQYANSSIPFKWNSDYRSFEDGSNCAEIIYRAWKDSSKGKIAPVRWRPVGLNRVMVPDAFSYSTNFSQIGDKAYR